jgi:hypothetical protein
MHMLSDLIGRLHAGAVVVFDLDSTLLSTQQRNHVILHEFIAQVGAPPDLHPIAARLTPADFGWNMMDDLRKRGFRHEPTLTRMRAVWLQRFFRNEYLHHDEPLPGAVEFVRGVHDAGAIVVYLTGRDEPNMGKGTRKSLLQHGFPLDEERVHLRLKPTFEEDDLAFKRAALAEIRALGPVAAVFENEPANANLFAEHFPDAEVVFLETVCAPNAPALLGRIVRLKDFRR